MLRFFSRRKPKGRKDQRGSGGYSTVSNGTSRKPLGPTSKHKNLECKVVFLDGEDDTFHITVSNFMICLLIVTKMLYSEFNLIFETLIELKLKFFICHWLNYIL